jgi:hypothetical protein
MRYEFATPEQGLPYRGTLYALQFHSWRGCCNRRRNWLVVVVFFDLNATTEPATLTTIANGIATAQYEVSYAMVPISICPHQPSFFW